MGIYSSNRFRILEKRVKELERNFIKIKPNGNYTKKEMDFHRAYRVLVHAEIESYLEDRAEEVTLHAKSKWDYGKANLVISSIIAHSNNDENIANKRNQISSPLVDRVTYASNTHLRRIRQNHGVKENNVYKLLLPLGMADTDIGSTLLSTLDTFGANRGLTAHNSFTNAQNIINPSDEVNTVTLIISELKILDKLINTLKYK